MELIRERLNQVNVDKATTYDNLTLFPLLSERNGADYLTLGEALKSGLASIREVSEGGSVPELLFENRAELPVLIVDGEELVGAKQNRTANLTILAPARKTIVIPVSCVEAGRWRHASAEFQVSERAHFARGRAAKMESVTCSAQHGGSRRSDQRRVWNDISAMAACMDASSPTQDMAAIFDRHRTRIEDYVEAFSPAAEQAGAIFAIGSEISGLDLFDHPLTLRTMLPKLVRSYALDAIERRREGGDPPGSEKAGSFMRRAAEAGYESYPAVGLGTDIRFTGDGLIAGGLVHDDRLIHLAAFAMPETAGGSRRESGGGMASIRARRNAHRNR
jgi:hypothetical protein